MYSRLVYSLSDQLNPHFISSHACDVFEETLLKAAGVDSQPSNCQFSPSRDEQKVRFRIKGISKEEAERFLSFLKSKCEDESATYTYLPNVEDVAVDSRDTNLIELNLSEKVLQALLETFKAEFANISAEKLAHYKKLSENDAHVRDYKQQLGLRRHYKLQHSLKQFLNPELISIHQCDIFEETLLKLAGVVTQPTGCKFSIQDHEKIYISVKGINADDAERMLGFLKEKCDDNATCKLIPAVSENQPAIDSDKGQNEAYHFEVNCEKATEKLIPLFKAEYANLSQEKLAAYRQLSQNFYEIVDEIQAKTRRNYEKLVAQVEQISNNQLITCYNTDVFEETLLKLAGIETQPEKSQFGPLYDKGKMYVRVKGLNEADVSKFLAFFRDTCGDASATHRFVENEYLRYGDSLQNAHSFEVNIEMVLNKLIPQFKEELDRLAANSPEKLANYRSLSEGHENIQKIQFAKLLEQIITLSAALKQECVNEFTKGQLDILFALIDPVLENFAVSKDVWTSKQELGQVGCLFNMTLQKNDSLKLNEAAVKLNDGLQSLFARAPRVKHYGLFSNAGPVENGAAYEIKLGHVAVPK